MNRHLHIRHARAEDLPSLVALYADDVLGQGREASDTQALQPYRDMLAVIEKEPNHILAVADIEGRVAATLLLSFLPVLSRGGRWRAQIESMRVARDLRGEGLGRELLDWAIDKARERGCALVQLTSDNQRADAHRFYERAGFTPSHTGFKRIIE